MGFETLVGEKGILYYCNEENCFQLGSIKFRVVEDEVDGYRSMLGVVQVDDPCSKITHKLAEVIIEEDFSNSHQYYHLRDDDGHIWLTFGTGDYDDYYPYFVFNTFNK